MKCCEKAGNAAGTSERGPERRWGPCRHMPTFFERCFCSPLPLSYLRYIQNIYIHTLVIFSCPQNASTRKRGSRNAAAPPRLFFVRMVLHKRAPSKVGYEDICAGSPKCTGSGTGPAQPERGRTCSLGVGSPYRMPLRYLPSVPAGSLPIGCLAGGIKQWYLLTIVEYVLKYLGRTNSSREADSVMTLCRRPSHSLASFSS